MKYTDFTCRQVDLTDERLVRRIPGVATSNSGNAGSFISLETRNLKRMRVSVTASKLIFHSWGRQSPLSKLTESSARNMRLGIEMPMAIFE